MIKLGEVVRKIRISKCLSEAEVADEVVTQPQVSRFERGKSNITVDKFFDILENMNVSLDEFQSVCNDFQLSAEAAFQNEVATAYRTKNVAQLKQLLGIWEQRVKDEPYKRYHRLNLIVIKCVLATLSTDFQVLESELEFLTDYLMDVEEWGRYEFWIFCYACRVLSRGTLRLLGDEILQRRAFYQDIIENKRLVVRVALRLVGTWLKLGEPGLALRYLKFVEQQHLSMECLYEQVMAKYCRGLYSQKLGDSAGAKMMQECVDLLQSFGHFSQATALEQEIRFGN